MKLRSQIILVLTVFFIGCCTLKSEAAPLQKAFNTHPRLYLTPAKLDQLIKLKNAEPYSLWLNNVKRRARGLMGRSAPASLIRYNNNSLRRPADSIVNFALYYLISGDILAFRHVEHLLETFSSTDVWAGNNDIGAAHSLFALSVAYDWLYDKLSPALRDSVRASISSHASIFYNMLRKHDFWWTRSPLQNHNYVNTAALAVAGAALYGEDSRAPKWIAAAKSNFDNVLQLLSPDGASHEGVGYWSYGTLWLLNYYMAMSPVYGLDQVRSSSFFRNTALYRLQTSLPGFKYNLDYADSARVDYKGPGAILRCLASIFNDGHAQWLAEKIETKRDGRSALWQDLLWYNPAVKSIPPDDLPTYKWFKNLGFLISRSSWHDDATLAFFKAGPPQGFLAQSKKVYAGSHIHPDAGSYTFWHGKEPLVQDDGYVMTKLSSSHNLLTFGGLGQLGEGGKWFRVQPYVKGRAHLDEPRTVIKKHYQIVSTNLENLYPELAAVQSWNRTFVIIDGRILIVRDKAVAKSKTDILSLIHLTRKARKYGNTVCLDFSSDIVLNTAFSAGKSSMKRYFLLTKPMGKEIPRPGKLYSIEAKGKKRVSFISVIAPSDNGCTRCTVLKEYDPKIDRALIEGKGGHYEVDFGSMNVKIYQEQS